MADIIKPSEMEIHLRSAELLKDGWAIVTEKVETGDVELLLGAIADYIALEKSCTPHTPVFDGVRACLEAAMDGCRKAAFDYYASTK